MSHYSLEDWMNYTENKIEPKVRENYEDHLYTCDQCLELYLQAVSQVENQLGDMNEESNFTDRIMSQVSEIKLPEQERAKDKRLERNKFYQSTAFHYTLAAAMTILFMVTGVFQSITNYADNVDSTKIKVKDQSMTSGVLEKTIGLLDSLEKTYKEGERK